nr:hypothetical protein [Tanacetum cinerariifolium]
MSARVKSSKIEGLGEEDASKQGRIADIDANKDITLVSTHDEQMFDVDQDLGVTTAATTPTISIDEVTLAQALAELKHTKPKAKVKGIVFYDLEESTTTTTTAIPKPNSQDKGKAKMIEELVKLKKKDQIHLNEEVALNLQAELQAEIKRKQRLAKEKKLIDLKKKSFDSIQRKFDKAFKRVNIFVDFRTKLVEESSKKAKAEVIEGCSKRARSKLEQESAKKQKINDDKDTAKLQQLVEIIPDE